MTTFNSAIRTMMLLALGISGTHAAAANLRPRPVFELPAARFTDASGTLHFVATARDGEIWHFREGPTGRVVAERLGKGAKGMPAGALGTGGLLQVWALGVDGTLKVKVQKSGSLDWKEWRRVPAPKAEEVATAAILGHGVAVALRRADGALLLGWSKRSQSLEKLSLVARAVGPGITVRGDLHGSTSLLYVVGKSELQEARFSTPGGKASVQRLDKANIRGRPTFAQLGNARALVVAEAVAGGLVAWEQDAGQWGPLHSLGQASLGLAAPEVVGVTDASAAIVARSPGGTFFVAERAFGKEVTAWTDTKISANGTTAPWISLGDRTVHAGSDYFATRSLGSLDLRNHFFGVSIDSVTPPAPYEDDTLTVTYTLYNGSNDVSDGTITATWSGRNKPVAVAPALGILHHGESYHGIFRIPAEAGDRWIGVHYSDKVCQALPGTPYTLCQMRQWADDTVKVHVRAYHDPLPTDAVDPPPGLPYACVTGPASTQDPPTAAVQSYNRQELCTETAGRFAPHTIAEVVSDVTTTAAAGKRLRVVGNLHTSNAQFCTEGNILSTENLTGAAPRLPPSAGFSGACHDVDCGAVLTGAPPVIESFEGVDVVRVGPGMKLHALANFLDGQGFSFGFAMPGFRVPTVGGAIANGVHGSSPLHPAVISTRVMWLAMALPSGEVREFSATLSDPDTWKAVRANLGYLGVVVQVRLAIEPRFNMRATTRWVNASALIAPGGPYNLLTGCDFGEMMWFPNKGDPNGQVMVICGTRTTDALMPGAQNSVLKPAWSDHDCCAQASTRFLTEEACAGVASCGFERLRYDVLKHWIPPFANTDCPTGADQAGCDTPLELTDCSDCNPFGSAAIGLGCFGAVSEHGDCDANVVGSWQDIESSDLPPPQNIPAERDWELYIPGAFAQEALQYAMSYFAANGICLPLFGVFLRFAPPEDGTLLAHTFLDPNLPIGPAGMFFEMPVFLPWPMSCADQARYEAVYVKLTEQLVTLFHARAHWGKNKAVLFQYERMHDVFSDNLKRFRPVMWALDPQGMFANQFGIDMGLRWPAASNIPSNTESERCVPAPTCIASKCPGPSARCFLDQCCQYRCSGHCGGQSCGLPCVGLCPASSSCTVIDGTASCQPLQQ